jgi:hypothetical protein
VKERDALTRLFVRNKGKKSTTCEKQTMKDSTGQCPSVFMLPFFHVLQCIMVPCLHASMRQSRSKHSHLHFGRSLHFS